MRALLLVSVLVGLPWLVSAQASRICAVCQTALGPRYMAFTSPVLAATQSVCQACAKLPNACAVCQLPVRTSERRLDDGRWLCARDLRAGVFNGTEARRVYEEVRRDLGGILAGFGVFPDRNIEPVTLVNGAEMKQMHQTMPTLHDASTTLGLTRTEISGARHFRHRIYLLNGLGRARLAAVCAHEYTHAWLHENLPDDRKLDRDTVEGFCELVAYKLMVQRRDDLQKKIILENAYTRGQVNAFVQAEGQHHFRRVVNWIKTGVDEVLAKTNTSRVLVVQEDGATSLAGWPPPTAVRTAVPPTLRLKGIAGVPSRRFALINDATLMKNEQGRVRVGETNVVVRCLDIRDRSVVIQVEGATELTELFLARTGE